MRNVRGTLRDALAGEENYRLEVFRFSPGSFRIHLQSQMAPDMFGRSSISGALERIDDLAEVIKSPEASLELVQENRGHLASAYTTLLGFISETDSKHHPLKQLKVEENQLSYYDPTGHKIIARQQLTPLYHRNGVAYVVARNCLLVDLSISGDRTGALVLNEHLISIDTMWDLEFAEFVYSHHSSHGSLTP